MNSTNYCSYNLNKYQSKNIIRKITIRNYYRILNSIIPNKLKQSSIRVLDAGCGEGFTIKYFNRKFPLWSFSGVDKNKGALRFALKNNHIKFSAVHASINSLPFKNKAFDLTFCLEVLEHLETPIVSLKELIRVSKYLIFTSPNEPTFRILRFMNGLNIKNFGLCPGHKQKWSYQNFLHFITPECKIDKSLCPFPYAWSYVLCQSKKDRFC